MSRPRRNVLETLRAQSEASTVDALARASALHANTVREHLAALVALGYAVRHAAPSEGRGRPAWLYEAVGQAPDRDSEYAGLAAALSRAIHRTSATPEADAVEAGREWGQELAQQRSAVVTTPASARREVIDLLDQMGFAPEADGQALTARLTRCPLLEAAHRYPEIVCGVHLGLTQGALAELGAPSQDVTLEPFAERGACLVRLTATP